MARLMLIRRGLSTLAAVGVVVIVGLVSQQASRFADEDGPARWRIEADISLTGFQLDQVGADGMELRLKADSAKLLEEAQRLDATGLDLTVFKQGKAAMTLTADRGELGLESGAVSVHGLPDRPATLSVMNGPTVTAPRLDWNPDRRTVESIGAAAIRQQGFIATGNKALAHLADERVQLLGDVRVIWRQ